MFLHLNITSRKFNIGNYYFFVKVISYVCNDEIHALATILARLYQLRNILVDLGEKMSYYVTSLFRALEKNLGNLWEYSGKRVVASATTSEFTGSSLQIQLFLFCFRCSNTNKSNSYFTICNIVDPFYVDIFAVINPGLQIEAT